MAFKMRINFVDVIEDGSLKNIYQNGRIVGFEFRIHLSDYRGEYLSCIDEFSVELDHIKMDAAMVSLNINGKSFVESQLRSLISEFWVVTDPATVKVMLIGGLDSKEHHIKLNLTLRKAYLPMPGANGVRAYLPLDASGEKALAISN